MPSQPQNPKKMKTHRLKTPFGNSTKRQKNIRKNGTKLDSCEPTCKHFAKLVSEGSLTESDAALGSVAELKNRILSRESVVQFQEVLAILSQVKFGGPILAFVRQRKLSSAAAKIEHKGFLIYPFLSYYFDGVLGGQMSDLSIEGQRGLVESIKVSEIEAESEFSFVCGGASDKGICEELQALFHAYFVSFELERCIERSAFLLMQQKSQGADGIAKPYEILKGTILEVFDTRMVFLSTADDEHIRIQDTETSFDGMPDVSELKELVSDVKRFRHSRSALVKRGKSHFMVHAIPMRQGSGNRVPEVMVLYSCGPSLSIFAIKLSEFFVRLTVDKLMERGRQKFERSVQREIISPTASGDSKIGSFEDFCHRITLQLSVLTNSHSVTVRKFSPFTNSLDLVSSFAFEKSDEASIAIKCDPSNSVNAFCFLQDTVTPYVYLPDIHNIPELYRSGGLSNALRSREKTNSEICLPIGSHPLRLGTLNLESANYAAYELDIEFLQSIAFHISQYWKTLSTVDDAWWLSQLSLTHLATHELRDFKETLDSPQRHALENIIYTISPAEHFNQNHEQKWTAFLNFVRRQHNRLASPDLFDKIWVIDGIDGDETISNRFLGSLRLIVHSMLSNTRHSEYTKNKIHIEKQVSGVNSVISIKYESRVSFVDPDSLVDLERRFSVPALSADGWHFGLFLIGVHARLLGGDVEIDPGCKVDFNYSPFSYIVRVAVPEAKHD